jgi:hypothetical protein
MFYLSVETTIVLNPAQVSIFKRLVHLEEVSGVEERGVERKGKRNEKKVTREVLLPKRFQNPFSLPRVEN